MGLSRDEATLQSDVYLDHLPQDLGGRRVIVCDPMLATGGSLAQVCSLVAARGAAEIVALCILASEPGLAAFTTGSSCRASATPVTGFSGRPTDAVAGEPCAQRARAAQAASSKTCRRLGKSALFVEGEICALTVRLTESAPFADAATNCV